MHESKPGKQRNRKRNTNLCHADHGFIDDVVSEKMESGLLSVALPPSASPISPHESALIVNSRSTSYDVCGVCGATVAVGREPEREKED